MKKVNIIKKNQEFKEILDLRNKYQNDYYNIYIKHSSKEYNRYGISVSKKIGNAVVRNKIKRQVKSIIDSKKDFKKTLDYIIIIKKSVLEASFQEMKDSLLEIIDKIEMMEEK